MTALRLLVLLSIWAAAAWSQDVNELVRRIQESAAANLTADAIVLDAWDRVKLARHASRPYTLDYIEALFTDFTEIHGDRRYGDDPAMIAGMARFHGEPCIVVGHQKGRTTRQRRSSTRANRATARASAAGRWTPRSSCRARARTRRHARRALCRSIW